MAICLDLETTDLLKPMDAGLEFQPRMTEICAVKFDEKTFKPIEKFLTFVNPMIPIPDHIVKVTGITDDMVRKAPKFSKVYSQLADFFVGERLVVGHNIGFDMGVLYVELKRLNLEARFPFPPVRHCTVELSYGIKNKRMKLGDLYEHYTGKRIENAHRAENDVLANIICYKHLCKEGRV